MLKVSDKKTEQKIYFILMLLGAAVLCFLSWWLNRNIVIEGLSSDDITAMPHFQQLGFLELLSAVGNGRMRLLNSLAMGVCAKAIGNQIYLLPYVLQAFHAAAAVLLFVFASKIARNGILGFCAALCYLFSRFSYYAVSQFYGIMETLTLIFSVSLLFCLFQYLNTQKPSRCKLYFGLACLFYVFAVFTHERTMVLFPLFIIAFFLREYKTLTVKKLFAFLLPPILLFTGYLALRWFLLRGSWMVGNAGYDISRTFSVEQAVRFAIENILYLFGFNPGEVHWLNGVAFSGLPMYAQALAYTGGALLGITIIGTVILAICNKERRSAVIKNTLLFLCFIGAMIVVNCISARLEMRWVYIPYAGLLLFFAYLCGEFWKSRKQGGKIAKILCSGAACLLLLYTVLSYPLEMCYRSYWNNLYYWHEQHVNNWIYENVQEPMGEEFWELDTVYVIDPWAAHSQRYTSRTFGAFEAHRPPEVAADRVPKQMILLQPFYIEPSKLEQNIVVIQVETSKDVMETEDITDVVKIKEITKEIVHHAKQSGGFRIGIDENGWVNPEAGLWITTEASGKIGVKGFYPFEEDMEIRFFVDDEEKAVVDAAGDEEFFVEIDTGKPDSKMILTITCNNCITPEGTKAQLCFLLKDVFAMEDMLQTA